MTSPPPRQLDLAVLIQQISSGLPFLYHGSAILFGVFGGPGPQGFASYMNIPLAVGYPVGLAQFAGGLAILTRALLRVGVVSVSIGMLGAILLAHLRHEFDINQGGREYALTQLMVALGSLLTGGGGYSLGRFLSASLQKLQA